MTPDLHAAEAEKLLLGLKPHLDDPTVRALAAVTHAILSHQATTPARTASTGAADSTASTAIEKPATVAASQWEITEPYVPADDVKPAEPRVMMRPPAGRTEASGDKPDRPASQVDPDLMSTTLITPASGSALDHQPEPGPGHVPTNEVIDYPGAEASEE